MLAMAISACDHAAAGFDLLDQPVGAGGRSGTEPDVVADGHDAAAVDLQALEQATDMTRIGPLLVIADHGDQPVHPNDSARAGMSTCRPRAWRRRRNPRAAVSRSPAFARVFDDRPVPRQLALGSNTIDRGRGCGGLVVVAELSGQVVGPRPVLAILPEGDPDLSLLHG